VADICDLICLDLPRAEQLRRARLTAEDAQRAARRTQALADATRLTLAAALLEGGELCVCDLSWIAGRAQNLVSHHLRVLRDEGLAESRRDGKLVMYSLTAGGRAMVGAVLRDATFAM
jgi:DNA-binding transcriptional ArsR family regulator